MIWLVIAQLPPVLVWGVTVLVEFEADPDNGVEDELPVEVLVEPGEALVDDPEVVALFVLAA